MKSTPRANIFTFQITNQCQLECRYCYTNSKAELPASMPREVAYHAIDYFVMNRSRFNSEAVSLDFIGGEPLLYIDLINDIICYFKNKCEEYNHPWSNKYAFSITTNGILYGEPRIQEFVKRYQKNLNINITVDGTRKRHNANRIYKDGKGSYDDIVSNIPLWTKQFPEAATKVTLTRKDLPEVCDCIENLWDLGIRNINIGFALEDDWQPEDAQVLESQLYTLVDHILKEGRNDGRRLPFFTTPHTEKLLDTRAGNGVCNAGGIVTVGIDGKLYPCARFAPGTKNPGPTRQIGDCVHGLKDDLLRPFESYDRRLYSPEKCAECDIENCCSWCHAANYGMADTPTICQPVFKLCEIHKAIARVNEYFWKICKQEEE